MSKVAVLLFDIAPNGVPREGVETVRLVGNELTVAGWFNDFGAWAETVTITDEQRRELHNATATD